MPKKNKFEITVERYGAENISYALKERNLKNNTVEKFILHSNSLWHEVSFNIPQLEFKIVNLTGTFSIGVGKNGLSNINTDALAGEALLLNRLENSISFFGSDKEIKNFEIKIQFTESLDSQGFRFDTYKPKNINSRYYRPLQGKDEKIYITISLHYLEYKKIKRSLEKGFIKEIYCNINLTNRENTSHIKGLYIADFCRTNSNGIYKILYSIDDIKNKANLPENFNNTGVSGVDFYQHNFSILITENFFFRKLEADNLDNENENNKLFTIEQTLLFNSLSKTEQALLSIEKQSENISTKLAWILIVIIFLVILKY